MLTSDYTKLMFANLRDACVENQPGLLLEGHPEPYNALAFSEYRHLPKCCFLWDKWSIGFLVLEVIAGTDIVLTANGIDEVDRLLEDLEEYIDAPTLRVVSSLLD